MFQWLCASAQQVPFATAPAALAGPPALLATGLEDLTKQVQCTAQ